MKNKNKKISSLLLLSVFLFSQIAVMVPTTFAQAEKPIATDHATVKSTVAAKKTEPIKIMPSLSASVVKNGQTLKINVLSKSINPVASATAEILELHQTIKLKLTSGNSLAGIWSEQWLAKGLKEQQYHVRLTLIDDKGYKLEDNSLNFSDPTLGITTAGSAIDAIGNLKRLGELDTGGLGGMEASAIDTTNQFAYFITNSVNSDVIKFNLSTFAVEPGGVVNLPVDDGDGHGIVFDPTNLLIYAAAADGKIFRIDADPSHTFAITATYDSGASLNNDSLVIDSANQFIYFGDNGSNGIYKVDIDPAHTFGQVAGSPLATPETSFTTAVLDDVNHYAYFATSEGPSHIVQIDLDTFTETGSIPTPLDNSFQLSAIDTVDQFAYFQTIEGHLEKVDTNPASGTFFTITNSINTPHGYGRAMAVDTTQTPHQLYIGSDVTVMSKMDTSTFAFTDLLMPDTEMSKMDTVVLDTTGPTHYAYFGRNMATGAVLKLDISSTDQPALPGPNFVEMPIQQANYQAAVIDPSAGYAYFAYTNLNYFQPFSHGGLVRVRLSDFTDNATLPFFTGQDQITSAVIDTSGATHYGYFGTNTDPGVIVKVDLTNFTDLGSLVLPSGEGDFKSAVIDTANQLAYFGTSNDQKIVKIDLGTFTETGDSPLVTGFNLTGGAAIDPANLVAYFGTDTDKVLKVDINPANTFAQTADSPLTLAPGEGNISSISLDLANNLGYLVTDGSPARIIKVDLAVPFNTSEVTTFNYSGGESNIKNSVIDTATNKLFLSGQTNSIFKFDLNSFTPEGGINISSFEQNTGPLVYDQSEANLYLGTDTNKGKIIKIAASRKNRINAYKVHLPTVALDISSFHFYSHTGTGNIRLALYDSAFNLKWDSGVIANTTTNGWIDVNTSEGTPTSLTNLPVGDYWLAFQTDSTEAVASNVVPSNNGDGFYFEQPFGAFPDPIAGGQLAADKYAFYATYTTPPSVDMVEGGAFGPSTDVTEGTLGNKANYDEVAVTLSEPPSANVTVTASPDSQITVSPSSLTFTPGNSGTPQYFVVGAVDDALPEGDHNGILSFTTSSTDLGYDGFSNPDITVHVTDNDVVPPAFLADDVIGELNNDDSPNFTSIDPDDGGSGPNNLGLNESILPSIDLVHHRLFVSDLGDARVLEYDLNADNTFADRVADHELGQPDFFSGTPSTTQTGFGGAAATAYDPVKNLLYVADQTNNRVMVFDVSTITDGEPAIDVLGQPDFTTGTSPTGPDQNSLFQPTGLAIDPQRQLLYVAEFQNSRVSVFDVSSLPNPGVFGQTAVHELGQPDFNTNGPGLTQTTMGVPLGMALDLPDNLLYVADVYDNRVTVYDVATIVDGEPAVHVLGQSDFTTSTAVTTQSGMSHPVSVVYDSVRHQLFTGEFNIFGTPGDPNNNRILMFDVNTLTDGQPAVGLLEQLHFTTTDAPPTINAQAGSEFPMSSAVDPANHRLYVSDFALNRARLYNFIIMSPDVLPGGTTGAAYSSTFSATKQQGVVSYVVTAGALPSGLSLSAAGALSGTPTTVGSFNFTVQARDTIGDGYIYDQKSYTVNVTQGSAGGGSSGGGGGGGGSSSFGSPACTGSNCVTTPTNAGVTASGVGAGLNALVCSRASDMPVPFTDIANHWAKDYIEKLYRKCVIDGKTPVIFDPDGNATRAELTKIAQRIFGIDGAKDFEDVFSDVHQGDWFATYVVAGVKLHILVGYAQGDLEAVFKPNQNITRAEALKVILLMKGVKLGNDAANYPDVAKTDWYYNYVAFATKHGIIEGYKVGSGPNIFAPNQPITRAEISKIAELTDELVVQ